jgi:uncharacterized membrane protein YgcG
MLILIPIALGAWGLWHLAHSKSTPKPAPKVAGEFVSVMHGTNKSAMVRLANQFGADSGQAKMLMNRANLPNRSPELKRMYTQVFQRALASSEPDAILEVAGVMRQYGMVHSANVLEAHGAGVKRSASIHGTRVRPSRGRPAPPSATQHHHHHKDQQQQQQDSGGGGGDSGGGGGGGGSDDGSGGDDGSGDDGGDDGSG